MQAKGLFNDVMYTQFIGIIDLAVKQAMITNDNFEMEFVSRFLISLFLSYFFLFSCMLELLLLCSIFFRPISGNMKQAIILYITQIKTIY